MATSNEDETTTVSGEEAASGEGLVTLKSGLESKEEVALFEKDERHPEGEVYVVGDTEVQAYLTGGVQKALNEGRVVRTDEGAASGEGEDESAGESDGGDTSAAALIARAQSAGSVAELDEIEAQAGGRVTVENAVAARRQELGG